MKKKLNSLLVIILSIYTLNAQKLIDNPDIITGTYYGEVQLFKNYEAAPNLSDIFTEREDKKWVGNIHNNPNAEPKGIDPAVQKNYNQSLINFASLGVNMDGVTSSSLNASFAPPDPVLDVGPNHVIQMSNAPGGSSVRIFDKEGKPLTNVLTFDTDFFPAATGAGDPIVLYDPLADRWLLSEFSSSGPNLLYVAISTTPNPVPPATWHVYSFAAPNFPDYPKYGIWEDAYYVTTNESGPSAVYAMPRTEMLAGQTAPAAQRFTMPSLNGFGFQAATPADIDGPAPPAGSPGIIMRMADDAVQGGGAAVDQLEIWEFDVDWDTPANTTLTNSLNLPTAAFSSELCGFTSFNCFPQQGTTQKLDPLRELLMYRVQYRNFGTHETIMCNHVTDVGDFTDHGGIRWYELRKTAATDWVIHQQGTYSPDTDHRWMGSIAMDGNGNVGLAYSTSSNSMYPSLKFTGRTAADNLGEMTVTETSIVEGTSFSNTERWGDYASLSVDPSDDCTFWFTGEYQTASGWATRIASFQIQCQPQPPVANFNADKIAICLFEENTVSFSDASTQSPTSWAWAFEGGTPATSTDQNPTITYSTAGTYNVQLIATNAEGANTVLKSDYITVTSAAVCGIPTAEFSADKTTICLDDATTVTFTDASTKTPTSWAWSFPGGTPTTSTDQNPIVNYTTAGVYEVTLTSTNAVASSAPITKTAYISVLASGVCEPEIKCNTFASSDSDLPITISNGSGSTITSTLTITSTEVITDINVINLKGTHTWISDLSFTLTSPEGTSIEIITRQCGEQDDFDLSLDDDGTIQTACSFLSDGGTYRPNTPLSNFIGENPAGDWVLSITDHASDDGGNLEGWGLEFCYDQLACQGTVLNIDGSVPADAYRASITLNSTGTVSTAEEVLFKAGTEILLTAPFTVPFGANFTARIAGCIPPVTGLQDNERIAVSRNNRYLFSNIKSKPTNTVAYNPVLNPPLTLHIAPNPLQYFTTLSYKVPYPEKVYLTIHNSLGQEIARLENGATKSPNIYQVNYEFEDKENGIYFARLVIGSQTITKRMLLLK